MTKTEYAEILKGERWQELRNKQLDLYPNCDHCQMPRWLAAIAYDQDLHVHHTSYASIGTDDEFYDLQTLCRRCHDIETFGRSELRAPKTAKCTVCKCIHWNPRSDYCEGCLGVFGAGYDLNRFVGVPHPDFLSDDGTGPDLLKVLASRLEFIYGEDRYLSDVLLSAIDNLQHFLSFPVDRTERSPTVANLLLCIIFTNYGTDHLLDALSLVSRAKAGQENNAPVPLFLEAPSR